MTRPKPLKMVGVNERGRLVGEGHQNSVLTDRDVQLIFELREAGWGYRRIAKVMECSKSVVRRIIKGKLRAQHPVRFKRCP